MTGRSSTGRKPTPSQVQMLRAVAEERVTLSHVNQGRMAAHWSGAPDGDYFQRLDRLWNRGWVTSQERPPVRERGMTRVVMVLTDEGRSVLGAVSDATTPAVQS